MSEKYLETIKSLDGKIYNLSYHQKRYERVLSSLGFSEFKSLQKYLNPPSLGLYRCRLIYDENEVVVTYHSYKKRNIKKLKLVYDDFIEYSNKSTDRKELDLLFEKREECDDVLIIKNSLVSDTTIANVAFFKDGLWFTPKKPLLKGTTRQRLLEEKKIIQIDIKVEDLNNYTKIALMNAMVDFDIITQYNLKDIIC
nr:aminotransferase class IV family protein [uncultured Sulfurimonas sp.]